MTSAHHAILALLFLIVGGCVGSFLNVCAYRIPRSMSLLRPRSRCPQCLAPIRAHDNVPVFGWLILAGKCRQCHGWISPRYAIVELTVGLLFAAVYLAAIRFARGDVWDRVGAWGVLAGLLAAWAAISLLVVRALLGSEMRQESRRRPLRSSVVGQEEE